MASDVSGVDIDLSKVSELGNGLLTQFDRLRESGPVHWSEASRCWIVTGHKEVLEGLAYRHINFRRRLPISSLRGTRPSGFRTPFVTFLASPRIWIRPTIRVYASCSCAP